MPHYHIRVADAGGSAAPTLPSIKLPKTAPAKAPTVPSAKPPPLPNAKPPRSPSPAPAPAGGRPAQPAARPASGAKTVSPVTRALHTGTRLAERARSGIERASEFGEQFNRDAGGAAMGHYHFNIPSRGSRMQRDYGTAEGAAKRSQGGGVNRNSQQSHTNQANFHKNAAAQHLQSGNRKAAAAHNTAYQAHSQAWRNPSAGNSAHAWGATFRASQGDSSTGGGMSSTAGGMSSTSGAGMSTTGMSMDAGTSEGAKKAAQTRSQGGSPYQSHTAKTPYWRGGELDIKAGSQSKQASPRRDPEPFRGYDSRRKK
jgi:hypothetical protein